ncbi:toxin-antitoxin system HicB family antitoxin [Methylobacterium sp. P1-11]|uniref:toxin-antitoxin system HicB family antitoxin n=1 Tax=Methylobacterium sp. P1-11 TaxID=2024616 RepID=UPI0011F02222|nr:toxin-antitoxin system HicB family antitoxin [Methylobacterium sp. P1-11]KAA0122246.1 toxin-antitoxin system HicB family antitoxin [Methylobacterium sp. P1-11]
MQQRKKTAQVNLRIDPALKEAAEMAAKEDQRSLTSLVEKLLTEHLKAKGYLK